METDDLRATANTEEEEDVNPTSTKRYIFLPLINTSFLPGRCLEAVQAIKNAKERDIAMGEYYYFSGHPEEAAKEMEPYLASEDTAIRLSACLVYAYANLATDNIRLARHALSEMEKTFSDVNNDTGG